MLFENNDGVPSSKLEEFPMISTARSSSTPLCSNGERRRFAEEAAS
jgi:hypothetical protein